MGEMNSSYLIKFIFSLKYNYTLSTLNTQNCHSHANGNLLTLNNII